MSASSFVLSSVVGPVCGAALGVVRTSLSTYIVLVVFISVA